MAAETAARVTSTALIPIEYAISVFFCLLALPKRAAIVMFHFAYVLSQIFVTSLFKPVGISTPGSFVCCSQRLRFCCVARPSIP